MNTTPPAVAIGPPRLGEPHSAGMFAACSGGSSRAGEPSGTSHSRPPAFRSMATSVPRSEERRVGKECRCWGSRYDYKNNEKDYDHDRDKVVSVGRRCT